METLIKQYKELKNLEGDQYVESYIDFIYSLKENKNYRLKLIFLSIYKKEIQDDLKIIALKYPDVDFKFIENSILNDKTLSNILISYLIDKSDSEDCKEFLNLYFKYNPIFHMEIEKHVYNDMIYSYDSRNYGSLVRENIFNRLKQILIPIMQEATEHPITHIDNRFKYSMINNLQTNSYKIYIELT